MMPANIIAYNTLLLKDAIQRFETDFKTPDWTSVAVTEEVARELSASTNVNMSLASLKKKVDDAKDSRPLACACIRLMCLCQMRSCCYELLDEKINERNFMALDYHIRRASQAVRQRLSLPSPHDIRPDTGVLVSAPRSGVEKNRPRTGVRSSTPRSIRSPRRRREEGMYTDDDALDDIQDILDSLNDGRARRPLLPSRRRSRSRPRAIFDDDGEEDDDGAGVGRSAAGNEAAEERRRRRRERDEDDEMKRRERDDSARRMDEEDRRRRREREDDDDRRRREREDEETRKLRERRNPKERKEREEDETRRKRSARTRRSGEKGSAWRRRRAGEKERDELKKREDERERQFRERERELEAKLKEAKNSSSGGEEGEETRWQTL